MIAGRSEHVHLCALLGQHVLYVYVLELVHFREHAECPLWAQVAQVGTCTASKPFMFMLVRYSCLFVVCSFPIKRSPVKILKS